MITERALRLLTPILLTATVLFTLQSNGKVSNKLNKKKTQPKPEIVHAIDDAIEANEMNQEQVTTENVALQNEIYTEATILQRRIRR